MTVDEAIATAEHEWRSLGVTQRDRAALAADLRLDLHAAAADGVSVEQLLDGDVRGFARRLAEEAGVRRAPGSYGHVLITAAAGAAIGALLGSLLPFHSIIYRLVTGPSAPLPSILWGSLYFAPYIVCAIAGASAAVRVLLRRVPAIEHTARAMAVLLSVAAVVVTPIHFVFDETRYTNSTPIYATIYALSGATFLGVTALARRWSLKDFEAATRNEQVPADPSHGRPNTLITLLFVGAVSIIVWRVFLWPPWMLVFEIVLLIGTFALLVAVVAGVYSLRGHRRRTTGAKQVTPAEPPHGSAYR